MKSVDKQSQISNKMYLYRNGKKEPSNEQNRRRASESEVGGSDGDRTNIKISNGEVRYVVSGSDKRVEDSTVLKEETLSDAEAVAVQ